MARGLIGTIELMVAVVLAARVTLLGVDNIARGQTTIGAVFLGLAAALLVIEWVAPSPTDIPGAIVGRARSALPGGNSPDRDDD
ncbi:hypothetical protein BVU17_13285 [Haloarcula taiwanensis]|uniref:Uncharacterized protein n=1 Tax=Haloarcula taiwanensis TaxID=1932004 RepID=A0A2H5A155_9EURY|nr:MULTISPECIES: hypothetical protein [Haloarcula]AUG48451.1 hypothetical protein BVU17_13285 [Haloarcula taiwanensis]RLM39808.1 hypothetical protein DVK01_04385 [Haloarcula sp. Atlit-120R]RLM47782.1 hypothetical protein DVK00_04540 [Haloarcula sp. Atlit-47R]